MPSHPVGLSERMSEPPASVKKGLPITAFLPGTGEVLPGKPEQRGQDLVATFVCCVLSILVSSIFFLDGQMFVYGCCSYCEGSEVQVFFEDSVQK